MPKESIGLSRLPQPEKLGKHTSTRYPKDYGESRILIHTIAFGLMDEQALETVERFDETINRLGVNSQAESAMWKHPISLKLLIHLNTQAELSGNPNRTEMASKIKECLNLAQTAEEKQVFAHGLLVQVNHYIRFGGENYPTLGQLAADSEWFDLGWSPIVGEGGMYSDTGELLLNVLNAIHTEATPNGKPRSGTEIASLHQAHAHRYRNADNKCPAEGPTTQIITTAGCNLTLKSIQRPERITAVSEKGLPKGLGSIVAEYNRLLESHS